MKNPKVKILIVTKDKALKKQFTALFIDDKYQFMWLDSLDRLLKYFESETFDLLIISGDVCKRDGPSHRDLIQIISRESPQTQILMMVRENRINLVADALDTGGYQYIRIPAPDEELQLDYQLNSGK